MFDLESDEVKESLERLQKIFQETRGKFQVAMMSGGQALTEDIPHPKWILDQLIEMKKGLTYLEYKSIIQESILAALFEVANFNKEVLYEKISHNLDEESKEFEEAKKKAESKIITPGNNRIKFN